MRYNFKAVCIVFFFVGLLNQGFCQHPNEKELDGKWEIHTFTPIHKTKDTASIVMNYFMFVLDAPRVLIDFQPKGKKFLFTGLNQDGKYIGKVGDETGNTFSLFRDDGNDYILLQKSDGTSEIDRYVIMNDTLKMYNCEKNTKTILIRFK